jgi:hypothetical protein
MTKLLSLALAAVVATSGMAASQSGAPQGNIFVGNDRSSGDNARQVAFDRVDAPAAGVVEVGDYQLHQMGQPLGREAVGRWHQLERAHQRRQAAHQRPPGRAQGQ